MEGVQDPGTPGFYFRLFLVPKKNRKLRPVISISLLNQYIRKQPFKMETVKSVRQSILVNELTVSVDAYLQVPSHPRYRKYLRFMFEDQAFQFTALPFRMTLSPWIFIKLIAAHLRQRATSLFPYLDDRLIKDLIRNRLVSHTIYCLQTVQSLGFIPNLKQSDFIPSLKLTFIGMEFLTQQNIVRVPADQVDSLLLTIKLFLSLTQVSARTFFSLLGKLSAAADFVHLGRLHLRPLQMCLLSVWRPHIFPLDHQAPINRLIRFYLKWWMDTNRFVLGTSTHHPDPNAFLFTDASHYGWEAHLEPIRQSFYGRWSEDHQYSGNDGHSFSTEESHKTHTPLLCYDLYRQYNSCLLYQQKRRNTFSQPMRRDMGTPPLVPGTRHRDQCRHIPGRINIYWQTVFRDWTDLSKQNGFWISR